MSNFARSSVWNCSMRGYQGPWSHFCSLVIRHCMCAKPVSIQVFVSEAIHVNEVRDAQKWLYMTYPLCPMFQRPVHLGSCQRPPNLIYLAVFQDWWDGLGVQVLGYRARNRERTLLNWMISFRNLCPIMGFDHQVITCYEARAHSSQTGAKLWAFCSVICANTVTNAFSSLNGTTSHSDFVRKFKVREKI